MNLDEAYELFRQAMTRAEPEREGFVRTQASSPEMAAYVLRLLESADPDALATGPGAPPPAVTDEIDEVEVIDDYRIIRRLGEGGFGVVYLAEQTAPVRRMVALKVIKPGMDSRAIVARFAAERQTLAVMDHPNVAKVLGAGTTERGLPYFVMEYVDGLPITEYCDAERLSIDDRLALFTQVCQAIQHAHQKGVIHRDLKPSNILVSANDDPVTPKVIDFGIAKAMDQSASEATVLTEQGQLIGSPEYMSPEQADLSTADIDTRSDIYSLGVVLYELLTGARPFSSDTLRCAGVMEIHRIIREEDPPRPSTRLSELGDALATHAEARAADARSLPTRVRGDLDWIVMRCLEKDRTRRYETASSLAADLRRHLSDEPVEAGPPDARYRIGKFVRRNRVGIAAAAAVLVVLLAGIAGTTWGLVAAERRADELEQVSNFQAEQFDRIDPARMADRLREDLVAEVRAAAARSEPDEATATAHADAFAAALGDANLTNVARETLKHSFFEPALAALADEFAEQPLVKARLLQTMANTMRRMSMHDAAMAPQTEALEIRLRLLGEEHEDTAESLDRMAFLHYRRGERAEAEAKWQRAFAIRRRILGVDHADTLNTQSKLASMPEDRNRGVESLRLFEELLVQQRRALGDDDPHTLMTMFHIGVLRMGLGRFAGAEPYLRAAYDGHHQHKDLGELHKDTLLTVDAMGVYYQGLGKYAEAEAYFRDRLDRSRRALGDDHQETLAAVGRLGLLLIARGRASEAEPLLRRWAGGMRSHPTRGASDNGLCILLLEQGAIETAMPHCRRAFDLLTEQRGTDNNGVLSAATRLARALECAGRVDEAETLHRDTLERWPRIVPSATPYSIDAVNHLGVFLLNNDRPTGAEPFLREAYESRRSLLGDDHPDALRSATSMAACALALGHPEEAETLARDSLARGIELPAADHWRVGYTRSVLGAAIAARGEYAEAERLLLHGLADLRGAPEHLWVMRRIPLAIERIVRLYEDWGRAEDASTWRRELAAARFPPPDRDEDDASAQSESD